MGVVSETTSTPTSSRTPTSSTSSSASAATAAPASPLVVVTGANGLVGEAVTRALLQRGARVRAVVRRAGTAPAGAEEVVGSFAQADVAETVVVGADALVTTVHPMGSDRATQQAVGVEATPALVRAAHDAGVPLAVHLSTAAVHDRSPGVGDVDQDAPLVDDDAGDYPVTKRDTDAAIAALEGPTRVLVRPPAVLGPGESSVWNTLRPADARRDPSHLAGHPERSFAWVHVEDLAALVADVATGRVPLADDPDRGPLAGGTTAVTVAGEPATWRDYAGTVAEAVGVEPAWSEEPGWSGQVRSDRARSWGWTPQVTLAHALDELRAGLR